MKIVHYLLQINPIVVVLIGVFLCFILDLSLKGVNYLDTYVKSDKERRYRYTITIKLMKTSILAMQLALLITAFIYTILFVANIVYNNIPELASQTSDLLIKQIKQILK